ncbi:grasp-with-spasm system ATP-grasp peptide maturase [Chryseobacterium camelliae]|uniref:ATP-GRASP peptide maturase of grasp-with-spasm system n=1 Tax=Chryseobacterium camelliae TaxID=1265445 RepID=A0ABU0TJJ4_9FLAO|nr:grasp-with-spasm system ATP-grasp peptide maturase [Chryseobacterium camelliae]MDQ1096455.1 ATP-GRASP peptide maturase of grasp-with-spasm system [Chryseobacterium camelliae]
MTMLQKSLESKKHISKESNSDINKLLVLEEARKIGLLVPDFFLAEDTNEVVLNDTIIKTIAGNPMIDNLNSKTDGIMYTTTIQDYEHNDFFITFFQDKIEKDYEIRSFYLNRKIWSMAIFSQNDEKTKTDFRRYNLERPNRNVRYNLPEDIEKKMQLLMLKLDLNCGSFDFIKNGDHYYFLEINTVGQFLGLSHICNYSLEKEIAEYL